MLPEKTSSFITVLPSNYTEINQFVSLFVKEMEAGYTNPIDIAIQLKAMEELIKSLRSNPFIRDMIMDEINKHPEKSFEHSGAKFEKSETGIKYDFTSCGSTQWTKLYEEKANADKKLKEVEKILKSLLTSEIEVYDNETGEQLTPPLKGSTSYVKVSLKK